MGVDYPVRSTERGSGDLEKDTGESDNEISQEQKHNSATKEAPLTVNSEQDVPWTLRRVVAIAALCTVYVGTYYPVSLCGWHILTVTVTTDLLFL